MRPRTLGADFYQDGFLKLILRHDQCIVTNMESRFPAMRVLWLGRDFYRDKYGLTGSSHVWSPDLGDEIWDLKSTGIFSISLLGEKIRLNVLDDSM
ncbi:hypothetical protein AVEN_212990-1 [Araneus ventricosus]|uniref:Uncharacterized protein n=1 Tax=Araneus ventricosus TaxID=182803 RepID=A0A4Y2TT50_ARAVE|nr:hypothetical protein AVEN_72904-1 [Araneus ventricosus]GBO00825.1 hypothetical protein AVEN_146878-1 [Araneus ventricosus]GBO02326.1 hypothetical protein AVEN_43851-1 [Araneus ventricosus]GBO02395.1 hypothetical protein AVEN_212990-1 [Araneus ventricosus]